MREPTHAGAECWEPCGRTRVSTILAGFNPAADAKGNYAVVVWHDNGGTLFNSLASVRNLETCKRQPVQNWEAPAKGHRQQSKRPRSLSPLDAGHIVSHKRWCKRVFLYRGSSIRKISHKNAG